MSAFSDLRAALAAELSPLLGITVHPAWPTVLDPPCGYITPPLTDSYITRGPAFAEHTIALDLTLMVPHGDAATALAELEALVQTAVVNTADWKLTGVDPPAPIPVSDGGAEYLACVIHLSKPVRL